MFSAVSELFFSETELFQSCSGLFSSDSVLFSAGQNSSHLVWNSKNTLINTTFALFSVHFLLKTLYFSLFTILQGTGGQEAWGRVGCVNSNFWLEFRRNDFFHIWYTPKEQVFRDPNTFSNLHEAFSSFSHFVLIQRWTALIQWKPALNSSETALISAGFLNPFWNSADQRWNFWNLWNSAVQRWFALGIQPGNNWRHLGLIWANRLFAHNWEYNQYEVSFFAFSLYGNDYDSFLPVYCAVRITNRQYHCYNSPHLIVVHMGKKVFVRITPCLFFFLKSFACFISTKTEVTGETAIS